MLLVISITQKSLFDQVEKILFNVIVLLYYWSKTLDLLIGND